MKTYARIQAGAIAELLTTDKQIGNLFYPSLQWVDVTGLIVMAGWIQQGTGFVPPPPATATLQPPTLEELQAQLATLSAQIGALTQHN